MTAQISAGGAIERAKAVLPWPPHRGPDGHRRTDGSGPVILYGWHSVTAALANPARRIRRLLATEMRCAASPKTASHCRLSPNWCGPMRSPPA